MTSFDKHDSILYSDLSRLFWGIYPYRVFLPYDEAIRWKHDKQKHTIQNRLWNKMIPAPDSVERKYLYNFKGISAFFVTEADAANFIDQNQELVTEVHRPHHDAALSVLADHKIRIRKTLFWNQYRWCVIFKNVKTTAEENYIDEWVESHFEGVEPSENRVYNSHGFPRKLYLNSENDTIAVKVSLSEHIRALEYAMLVEEVSTENG